MTDRISVRRLIELLPDLIEFDPLRNALRRISAQDGNQRADRRAYSTIDTRSITFSNIGSTLVDAESEVRRHVKKLYDAANIAFSAEASGDAVGKARQLVVLGEAAEAAEEWREALAYYMLANGITRSAEDLSLRSLVLRRVGRAALNAGEFARSAYFYSSSLATASIASDAEGQAVAATGLGNVSSLQGRWAEADEWYARAVSHCDERLSREKAQLLVNRSVTHRERELLAEAAEFLEAARAEWQHLTAADRAGWYNNLGLLRLAHGELADAQSAFQHALVDEPGYYHRSMVLDNLSEVALRVGNWQMAERRIREAEDFAVAHGSPRALAEIYMQMGRIARAKRDPNGVMYFDKALEITREKTYPLLVGEIQYEYGLFRKAFGEMTAAQELWHAALTTFGMLGATTNVKLVEKELATAPD